MNVCMYVGDLQMTSNVALPQTCSSQQLIGNYFCSLVQLESRILWLDVSKHGSYQYLVRDGDIDWPSSEQLGTLSYSPDGIIQYRIWVSYLENFTTGIFQRRHSFYMLPYHGTIFVVAKTMFIINISYWPACLLFSLPRTTYKLFFGRRPIWASGHRRWTGGRWRREEELPLRLQKTSHLVYTLRFTPSTTCEVLGIGFHPSYYIS